MSSTGHDDGNNDKATSTTIEKGLEINGNVTKIQVPTKKQDDDDDEVPTFYTNYDSAEFDYCTNRRQIPEYVTDKYVIGAILGKGAMCEVIEVLELDTLRRLAVKKIKLGRILNSLPRTRARTQKQIADEIRLLRRLKHKNIIKLIDVYSEEFDSSIEDNFKSLYIFLEYCSATITDLMPLIEPDKHQLTRRPLPIWQAHRFFVQLIDGLEYLHGQGVIHCDIKPANLLINNDNCLKIIDFNISQEVIGRVDYYSPSDNFRSSANVYGTAGYQAPELFGAHVPELSGSKVDIFSAGATLFYMIIGDLPWNTRDIVTDEALNTQMFQRNMINKPHQTPPDLIKQPALHELIDKMLEKNPINRITIDAIRRSLWFMAQFKVDEIANIPPRGLHGDQYRSMTITSQLHERHYPLIGEERTVQVPHSEHDEYLHRQKVPLTRANRSQAKKRSPPGQNSNIR